MSTGSRSTSYEVWSRSESGSLEKHGTAFGVTFEDACKHLASESIDFWTHYDKGRYRGRRLFESRGQAADSNKPVAVAAPAKD